MAPEEGFMKRALGFVVPMYNSAATLASVVHENRFHIVWTQERSDSANPGDFGLGPDLTRLLAATADDVVLVKMSYCSAADWRALRLRHSMILFGARRAED